MIEQRRALQRVVETIAQSDLSMKHATAQVTEAIRTLTESPLFPILMKMHQSKGLLKGMEAAESIMFVPDAVLNYGFGHVPTDTDPEGKLFEQLEQPPSRRQLEAGTYLYSQSLSGAPKSKKKTSRADSQVTEAEHVHTMSGQEGLDPRLVYDALMMTPNIDYVWVSVDLEEDIDEQFNDFRKWLKAFRRELHRRPGKRGYNKREAPRDTLIYTLKESLGLKSREIAERIFPEYSERNAYELDGRVRQSLRRTRAALKAAGYGASPASENVTE